MTFIRMCLRITSKHKTRLICTMLIILLTSLLSLLFLTIGTNLSYYEDTFYSGKDYYRFVYATPGQHAVFNSFDEFETETDIAMIKTNTGVEIAFEEGKTGIPVAYYTSKKGCLFPICSSPIVMSENGGLYIGKNLAEDYGIDSSILLNSNLQTNDNNTISVSALFDDSFAPLSCLLISDDVDLPDLYVFKVHDFDMVKEISSKLLSEGYEVKSYADSIQMHEEHMKLVSTVSYAGSLCAILFSVFMVYSFVDESLRDMYPFIAMTWAIGYKNIDRLKMLLINATCIVLPSVVLSACLYFGELCALRKILSLLKVHSLYDLSVDAMLKSNVEVLLWALLALVLEIVAICLIVHARVSRLDTRAIAREVNL